MKELKVNQPHKFKKLLKEYGITQILLANNLSISQAELCTMLNGHKIMNPIYEREIGELLEYQAKGRV